MNKWYHWLIYGGLAVFALYSATNSIINYVNCESGVMGIGFPSYVCIEAQDEAMEDK